VAYTLRPLPSSEASQVARDKRKAEVSKKLATKRAKVGMSRATPSKTAPPPFRSMPPPSKTALPLSKTRLSKKIGVVKVVRPRVKTVPQGMSEIELALVKQVGVSIFFLLIRCSSFVS
jgi:hypothetical protein